MYIEREYLKLLKDILSNGVEKQDRTGTGTLSVFGRQIRHSMSKGFPLLTTKKMPMRLVATELLWFLRGDTNIKFLHDHDCHIWDGDYEKSGRTDGELGPIYGKQWRDWNSSEAEFEGLSGVDQIANLINDLKTNPDSRRLMVNAWNVGELEQMVLPPCHYGFQVYTRELSLEERRKLANHDSIVISPITVESWDRNNIPTRAISLMWNQRSVDTFLGLPFNIASYGLLLEIIAKEVNMVPDELIGNLGDVHLYSNHIEQAKEQLTREPMPLSELVINDEFWNPDASFIEQIEHIQPTDFFIKDYQSHPAIKALLSN
jgi:thymidylate synthase